MTKYALLTRGDHGLTFLGRPTNYGEDPVVERLWFWTEPKFRVKVSYLERTEDGRLRFPAYRGEL